MTRDMTIHCRPVRISRRDLLPEYGHSLRQSRALA